VTPAKRRPTAPAPRRVRKGAVRPGPRRPQLLLDANVVLDVLANRAPWAHEAALLLSAVDAGRATAAVAAHTVTTLYYLLAKALGRDEAVAALVRLTKLVDVVAVDRAVILETIALGVRDLEDAVQAVCGLRIGADYLVTRNARDFRGVGLTIATPGEVLAQL
jgi:predicted nucleic acid-binding protein